jgi:DNA-binding MarR family transcriptional regulator
MFTPSSMSERRAPPSARATQPNTDSQAPQGHLRADGIHDVLGYQLAQATIVTTGAFIKTVGEPLDLRPVEFTVLQLVCENAPVTATQLAKTLAVTTPGITSWIDRLEKRGLVVRERSDTDRRTQNLNVTSDGQALVKSAVGKLLQAEGELLTGLSEGERRMLLELLHKVARGTGSDPLLAAGH